MSRRDAVREQYGALVDAIEAQTKDGKGDQQDAAIALRSQPAVARVIAKDRPGELGASDPDVVAAAIASRTLRNRTIDLRDDVAEGIDACFEKLMSTSLSTNQKYSHSAATRLLLLLAQPPTADTSSFARQLKASGRTGAYQNGSTTQRKLFEKELWVRILHEDDQRNAFQGQEAGEEDDDEDSETWSDLSRHASSSSDADERDVATRVESEAAKRNALRRDINERIEARRRELNEARAALVQEHRKSQAEQRLLLKTLGERPAKPWTECEVIREVLLALDGLPNRIMSQGADGYSDPVYARSARTIKIPHYQDVTFTKLLSTFAHYATISQELRSFAAACLDPLACGPTSTFLLSLRAVACTVHTQLATISAERADWDVQAILMQEDDLHRARRHQDTVTLASFSANLEKQMKPIEAVHGALLSASVLKRDDDENIDLFINSLQEALEFETALQGFAASSCDALAQCLLAAFRPLWHEMRDWVVHGGLLPDEQSQSDDGHIIRAFFAKRDLSINPREARFWHNAIRLEASYTLPEWLISIAEDILSASKHVALLRVMQMADDVDQFDWELFPDQHVVAPAPPALSRKDRISQALFGKSLKNTEARHSPTVKGAAVEMATTLPSVAQAKARDICRTLQVRLTKILTTPSRDMTYDLLAHVDALHNICLWQRGDDFAGWAEDAFGKIKSNRGLHTMPDLSLHLQDQASSCCVDPNLLRSSFASHGDQVRASCTYMVPWPLVYILTPAVISAYEVIFASLFDLERAAYTLKTFALRRPAVLHAAASMDLQALLSADSSVGDASALAANAASQHVLSVLYGDTLPGRRLFATRRLCICIAELLRAHMRRDTIPIFANHMRTEVRTLVGIDDLAEAQQSSIRRLATLLLINTPGLGEQDYVLEQALARAATAVQKLVKLTFDADIAIDSCFSDHLRSKSRIRKTEELMGDRDKQADASSDRHNWEQAPKKRRSKDSEEDDIGADDHGAETSFVDMTTTTDEYMMDADASFSSTSLSVSTKPTPQTDLDRWLTMLERGVASCLKTLRQEIGTCVRCAVRLGDDEMRDGFGTLLDGLEQIAGL